MAGVAHYVQSERQDGYKSERPRDRGSAASREKERTNCLDQEPLQEVSGKRESRRMVRTSVKPGVGAPCDGM